MKKKINNVEILNSINNKIGAKELDFSSLMMFISHNNIDKDLDIFFKSNPKITEKDIRDLKLSEKTQEIIDIYISENDINLEDDIDSGLNIDFSDNKQILMADIRRTTVLSSDEVNRLIPLAHNGDIDAKNKLITANLRLVLKVVKKSCHSKEDFMDSFQNGCNGLIRAIEKYNPNIKCKLSTYAVFWIRSFISRGFVDLKTGFNLSYQGTALLNRINAIRSNFFNENGRDISDEELASVLAEIEIKKDKSRSLEGHKKYFKKKIDEFNIVSNITSLDSSISDSLDVTSDNAKVSSVVDESIDIENDFINNSVIKDLLNIIDSELPPKHAEIIKMKCGFYNGREISFVEIAKHYGVTYQYISKLYHEGIAKLRQNEKVKKFK